MIKLQKKNIVLMIAVFLAVFLFSGCSLNSDPAVKKSNTGICHEKGTFFYNNTKKFTAYNSIDECLRSGGRLPKK